jgi:hypothetical protein
VYRYRVHDTDGDDLGELQHPAPNLEPGDTVTTEDGRRWRVVRYVPAPERLRCFGCWRSNRSRPPRTV